jgi:asparagine synthase (glutamine-hydrolysing)
MTHGERVRVGQALQHPPARGGRQEPYRAGADDGTRIAATDPVGGAHSLALFFNPEQHRMTNASLVLERRGQVWDAVGAHSASLGHRDQDRDGGTWAEWAWQNGKLRLQNDRFGFFPVFYSHRPDRIGLSTSLLDLIRLGVPTDLDDDALAVFLRLGCFLGDDTPFTAIRALPPRCDINEAPDAIRWRQRSAEVSAATASTPRRLAKKHYYELFRNAVAQLPIAPGDRVGLPLSGGRDSRHIAFALARNARPPACCITMRHYPPKSNEDAAIAAQVAAAIGVPHVILDPPRDVVGAEREKNRMTHFCASEHTWILPLPEYAQSRELNVLVDGIGGDVLSAGLFLTPHRLELYEQGRLRQLADHLLGGEGYLPKMLPVSLYRRWSRERALQRLEAELALYSDSPNPVGQFFFWNRTRRQIALSTWGILASAAKVFAPYLSHEVYEFLAALPASMFVDHNFHTEVIRESYPEYAHIPFENKAYDRTSSRSQVARVVASAAGLSLSPSTNMTYVRRAFLLPRIAKALVNIEAGTAVRDLLAKPIYLMQLAEVQREA